MIGTLIKYNMDFKEGNVMIEWILFPIKKLLWRKKNKHNFTVLGKNFSTSRVRVGKATYGVLNVTTYGNEKECLEIGSYCSIADNVNFLLSGEHSYNTISTYPFKTKILKQGEEALCKGKIVIGDDVWIGYGATILSGVNIGQGVIIGAGTVVAKDIPPYAIYVNGRILKYRFSEKVIEKLLKIEYGKIDKKYIEENLEDFYKECNIEVLEKFKGLEKSNE